MDTSGLGVKLLQLCGDGKKFAEIQELLESLVAEDERHDVMRYTDLVSES